MIGAILFDVAVICLLAPIIYYSYRKANRVVLFEFWVALCFLCSFISLLFVFKLLGDMGEYLK